MDAEVGIVGLGTMGSMTAWQLSKKGKAIIGFEQFGIGHEKSAAGGETRIFRTIYKEGLEYASLLEESYRLWRLLEKESGDKLLYINKGLTIGDSKSKFIKKGKESIENVDLNGYILGEKKAKELYPQHKLQSNEEIIVDPKAGYIKASQAIIAATNIAKKYKAKIIDYSPVKEIKQFDNQIKIKTQHKTYSVKKVLITTGPWSELFVPSLHYKLNIHRLINAWFLPKDPFFSSTNFPVFIRELTKGSYYGLPGNSNDNLIKIGLSATKETRISHPACLYNKVNESEINYISKIVKNHLPILYEEPSKVGAYMDLYTDDKRPILGFLPENQNILLITAFSGHGFKMAPAIRKIGAEMLHEGETNFKNIKKFSPSRVLRS